MGSLSLEDVLDLLEPIPTVPNSAVAKELSRQLVAPTEHIDATKLWIASGRKRNKSPRAWLPRAEIVHDPGGRSADVPILIARERALHYSLILCDKLLVAYGEAHNQTIYNDPVTTIRNNLENQLVCFLAIRDVMYRRKIDADDAADWIVSKAVDATKNWDPISQETEVAKMQRAVRWVRTKRAG